CGTVRPSPHTLKPGLSSNQGRALCGRPGAVLSAPHHTLSNPVCHLTKVGPCVADQVRYCPPLTTHSQTRSVI
ncbi:hypothetical protein J6590_104773, partial [Homalodisca vitripennis]